ncbi:MAG TPA: threonine/serine exporter family protein [Acidobacteriota bacterium]|nr:threonine/serine exporter family protein [Acidobacteriota bacterium]
MSSLLLDMQDFSSAPPSHTDDYSIADTLPKLVTQALRAETSSIAFVLKLGKALHQYGTPAHRLEDTLVDISNTLGLEGQFFSTPTSIFASFGDPEEQRTTLIRVEPGEVNLEKLVLLDTLAEQVLDGTLTPSEGAQQIDEIVAARPRYGDFLTAICFGISSGAASRFLGGGWREILMATVIGMALGIFAWLAGRYPNLSRVFDPVSAIIASVLAIVATQVFAPISVYITTLGGLIVLVPGLTLTVAMNELAQRSLVAGTARLMSAILLLIEIGFGVALGTQIQRILPAVSMFQRPEPLPWWTEPLALLIAPLSLAVLFRARPKDMGWILLSALVGFWGARTGAWMLGPELGVCLGALLVGLAGNLYNKYKKRPAAVLLVPGIMLLVPGSVGYGSVAKFLEKDVVSGVEAAFRMILVAIALVTGLLLANTTMPPRKAL